MEFDNLDYFSKSKYGLDTLKIKVLEPFIFISKSSRQTIEDDFEVESEIPEQFTEDRQSLIETLESAAEKLESSGTILASSNAGIQIALSASLALVWGLINSLQLVAHFPLMVVQYPKNAEIYNNMLLTIATMDLIPDDVSTAIKEDFFGVYENEE